jgi:diguanylate cyclase (GGDEF)-like protein/PAS domain S-box-containing protein
MTRIKRWLAPPVFEGDENRTLQASLLNMIGLTCVIFSVAVMAGALLGGKTPTVTLYIDVFACGIILLFLHWLRHGRLELARSGMVSFGLVYIIGVTASLGTIRTPTASILLFWVLMTGLLYDLKGIVIGTAAASLAVLGLIVAENSGWLRHPYYGVGVTQWITFTALFGFSSGLTYFVILDKKRALARAEKEIEQRKQVEAQLVAAKNDLKGMIDALPDLLFEVGPDGTIHDYHSPRADLLAVSPAAFIGNKFSEFLPPDVAEAVRGALREAASKGGSSGTTYALELPGGKRWFELSVALKGDADDPRRRFICLARDITLRRQTQEALTAANEELKMRVLEVERLHGELHQQTLHDPLTGLHNRRYLDEALTREFMRARREDIPVGIVMADIDHFKLINDSYGHRVGDEVLVQVSGLLKNLTRGSDIVFRYGGEEFLLVFPGMNAESARNKAEEIRNGCAALSVQSDRKTLNVMMSFGVAAFPDHGEHWEQIIDKADKAMYQSKCEGRNRVTVFHS